MKNPCSGEEVMSLPFNSTIKEIEIIQKVEREGIATSELGGSWKQGMWLKRGELWDQEIMG